MTKKIGMSGWGRLASSVVVGALALAGAILPPAGAATVPDAAVGRFDPADTPPAPGPQFDLSAASQTHCDGDGSSGKRVQVVYVRFSDRPNRYGANLAAFRQWAGQADRMFEDSAARTGGHRHIRFVHDKACNVVVASATVPSSIMEAEKPYDALKDELRATFGDPNRKYMVFADFPAYELKLGDACGKAEQRLDDSPGAANKSNGTGLSFIFQNCWGNGTTPGHELAHNLGAVQFSAPHSDQNGHCTDGDDALCEEVSPGASRCIDHRDERRLDCNHDDYFSTKPLPGSYLATHWNVADSPYLAKGAQSAWGYVWADQPTSAEYVPPVARQRNSSGAKNTVSRQSTGTYVVSFPNVALARGTFPHVSASGPGAGWCQARTWSHGWLGVACFGPGGSPADRPFLASVNTPAGTIGPLAQLVVLGALSRDPGFNSAGGTNTVLARGDGERRGVWTVRMPGVGRGQKPNETDKGNVQVTAVGHAPAACRAGHWTSTGPDVWVTVQCHDAAGALVDAPFVVSYAKGVDVTGIPGRTAYAVRDESAIMKNVSLYGSGSDPFEVFDRNVDPTVKVEGTGVWTVTMERLAPPQASNGGGSGGGLGNTPLARGHVQVSAAGPSHHCGVDSWKSAPGDDGNVIVTATVRCFDHAGQPVQGGFSMSYTTD